MPQVLHLVHYPLGANARITAIVYDDFLRDSR
jgi:hypothetical protein